MRTPIQLQCLVLIGSGTATINIPGPGLLVGLVLESSCSVGATSGGLSTGIISCQLTNTVQSVTASGVQATQVLAAALHTLPSTTASNTANSTNSQTFAISRRTRTGDTLSLIGSWTGIQPSINASLLITWIPD